MLQWISWVIGLPLGRLLGGQRGDYGQGFRTRGFAKRRVIVAHAWDVWSAGSPLTVSVALHLRMGEKGKN